MIRVANTTTSGETATTTYTYFRYMVSKSGSISKVDCESNGRLFRMEYTEENKEGTKVYLSESSYQSTAAVIQKGNIVVTGISGNGTISGYGSVYFAKDAAAGSELIINSQGEVIYLGSELANDIFGENGEVAQGVVSAEIASGTMAFDLKITGFTTEEQKNAQIALGAYVKTTKGDTVAYSYMQNKAPNEGEGYHFASFNDATKEN